MRKGASTFRDASRGQYKQSSEAIADIRKEVFEKGNGRSDDKKNLLKDRENIAKDVRKSFDRLVATGI